MEKSNNIEIIIHESSISEEAEEMLKLYEIMCEGMESKLKDSESIFYM